MEFSPLLHLCKHLWPCVFAVSHYCRATPLKGTKEGHCSSRFCSLGGGGVAPQVGHVYIIRWCRATAGVAATVSHHFLRGGSLKGRCNIRVYVPVCVCVPVCPSSAPPDPTHTVGLNSRRPTPGIAISLVWYRTCFEPPARNRRGGMAWPPPRGPPWKLLLRVSVSGPFSARMCVVVRYYMVCVMYMLYCQVFPGFCSER